MKTAVFTLIASALVASVAAEDRLILKCLKEEVLSYDAKLDHKLSLTEQAQHLVLTFKVNVTCVADNFLKIFQARGLKFRLAVYNLSVAVVEKQSGKSKETARQRRRLQRKANRKLRKPFFFIQLENGTITHVLHKKDDDLQVINFKKAVADLFQVALSVGQFETAEIGANNKRTTHYKVEDRGNNEVKVHKQYSSPDIQRFAKGYAVDPSQFLYSEEEDLALEDGIPKQLSGTLKAVLLTEKNDYSGRSSAKATTIKAEQFYSLSFISRTKVQKRSAALVEVDDLHGLQLSSIESTHDQVNAMENQHRLLSSDLPLLLKQLQDISDADGNYNKSYSKLSALLKLEGLCEHHQCPSGSQLPLTEALIISFNSGSPNVRHALFPLLVASSSKTSQEMLIAALKSPEKYGLDPKLVLAHVPFIRKPSTEIVSYVTNLALVATQEVRSRALLALGGLAPSVRDSQTANQILELLMKQLRSSSGDTAQTATLLLAIGNTQNLKATEPLIVVLGNTSATEEVRCTAAVVLNQLAEVDQSYVDNLLVKSLQELANSTTELVSGIITLLSDRLLQREKYEESPLEKAIEGLFGGSKALAERYEGYVEAKEGKRLRRETSYNWASSSSSFKTIDDLINRREDVSRYKSHLALLYSKTIGTDNINLTFAAGAFAGINLQDPSPVKIFGKLVGTANAFGWSYTVLDAYVLLTGTGKSVNYTRYARIAEKTIIPYESTLFGMCHPFSFSLFEKQLTELFGNEKAVPFFDETVPLLGFVSANLKLTGSVSLDASVGFKLCDLSSPIATAYFKPSATLTVDGSASVGALYFEGGIKATASIKFFLKPEVLLKRRGSELSSCLNFYYGNDPSSVDVSAFYKYPGGDKTSCCYHDSFSLLKSSEVKLYGWCYP